MSSCVGEEVHAADIVARIAANLMASKSLVAHCQPKKEKTKQEPLKGA